MKSTTSAGPLPPSYICHRIGLNENPYVSLYLKSGDDSPKLSSYAQKQRFTSHPSFFLGGL